MGRLIALGITLVVLGSVAGFAPEPLPSLFGLLAVAIVLAGIYQIRRRRMILRAFRVTHVANGRDLLLVYSDSPHWKEYIEREWVPRWRDRVVFLNRSRPWTKDQLEVRLWREEAGASEHTPVAIVVAQSSSPTIVRFWRAFRDYNHGKDARLRQAERDLEMALRASRP